MLGGKAADGPEWCKLGGLEEKRVKEDEKLKRWKDRKFIDETYSGKKGDLRRSCTV